MALFTETFTTIDSHYLDAYLIPALFRDIVDAIKVLDIIAANIQLKILLIRVSENCSSKRKVND